MYVHMSMSGPRLASPICTVSVDLTVRSYLTCLGNLPVVLPGGKQEAALYDPVVLLHNIQVIERPL